MRLDPCLDMRNTTFDALKGFLILLVILGHTLLGPIDQSWLRGGIYFFHMPLFLALTGYFVKYELLLKRSVDVYRKYYERLIIPYFLAFSVYTSMNWYGAYRVGDLTIIRILVSFLSPSYHLWYIPAIILYIFYTKALVHVGLKSVFLAVLLFSYSLTILFAVYGEPMDAMEWTKLLGDSRYYYLYYYFMLGYLLSKMKISLKIVKTVTIVLPMILIAYYFSEKLYMRAFSMVISNSIIILLVFTLCENFKSHKNSYLSNIGQVSLPIYLWHELPIIITRKTIPEGGAAYYLCSGALCVMLIYLIVILREKSDLLNRYVYGSKLLDIADNGSRDLLFRDSTR